MVTLRTIGLTIMIAIGVAGCGDSMSPTAPTGTSFSPAVEATLERGIQDEYRAETIYQGVVNDFGPILPFVNVLTAEERHSASIARLYASRGLPAPASAWSVEGVPHFGTVAEACVAAAAAERDNIAMYDDLLALDLPDDVRRVFANNRSASLLNHLPAFERCS